MLIILYNIKEIIINLDVSIHQHFPSFHPELVITDALIETYRLDKFVLFIVDD